MEKKCLFCNNVFVRGNKKPYEFKKQVFCTKRCSLLFRNKFNNPVKNKETLLKMSGKNSKFWKGENAGYFTKHDWIRSQGIERDTCEECGIAGFYYKNNRWSIEFCNISGDYLRDISDWKCLCRKCHRKFDNNKRDIETIVCSTCSNIIHTKYKNYFKRCKDCSLKIYREKNKIRQRNIRGYSGRKWTRQNT